VLRVALKNVRQCPRDEYRVAAKKRRRSASMCQSWQPIMCVSVLEKCRGWQPKHSVRVHANCRCWHSKCAPVSARRFECGIQKGHHCKRKVSRVAAEKFRHCECNVSRVAPKKNVNALEKYAGWKPKKASVCRRSIEGITKN
jgi:hypothetical protein